MLLFIVPSAFALYFVLKPPAEPKPEREEQRIAEAARTAGVADVLVPSGAPGVVDVLVPNGAPGAGGIQASSTAGK